MEVLEKIFGSAAKVKIMRLFLFNPQQSFTLDAVVSWTKVARVTARREMSILEKIQLVKRRTVKRKPTWTLNDTFLYIKPLKEFLVEMGPIKHSDIASRLKKIGPLKLIIVSGVFTHDGESRVDLLIVGDKINRRALEGVIRAMEAEIGKELVYAVFDTSDFQYRLGMYDKLLRDILDYPHQKIVNKFGDLS